MATAYMAQGGGGASSILIDARKGKAKKRLEELKEAERAEAEAVKHKVAPLLRLYDADGSGMLERPEILGMLQSMAPGASVPSEQTTDAIIRFVTGHKDAPVTVETLPRLMIMLYDFARQAMLAEQMLQEYDKDSSGKLDVEELLELLKHTSKEISAHARIGSGDVLYILSRVDLDRDCKLSRDELVPALALWREIVPRLPTSDGEAEEDELDAAAISRAILEEQNRELDGEENDVSALSPASLPKLDVTDSVSIAADDDMNQRYRTEEDDEEADSNYHWLEGVTIIKDGINKSVVRTRDGKKHLVENSELKEAQRVQGRRIAGERALQQAKLSSAAILLDEKLAAGNFHGDMPPHLDMNQQTFAQLNQSHVAPQKASICALL